MPKIQDRIDDIEDVIDINTGDLIDFKLVSHEIKENFELIAARLNELQERIEKLEQKETQKWFHALSREIEKLIRLHSSRLVKEPPLIDANQPPDYTSEIITRLSRERSTDESLIEDL